MLLTDFCNRLHDTSTRESFGFRVSDFRLDEPSSRLHRGLSLGDMREGGASLPCGETGPGWMRA